MEEFVEIVVVPKSLALMVVWVAPLLGRSSDPGPLILGLSGLRPSSIFGGLGSFLVHL